MDFFEHQEAARRKSKLLIFYFALAVMLIVITFNIIALFVIKTPEQPINGELFSFWFGHEMFFWATFGTLGIISLGSLFRWIQLRDGGKAVARMMNAREVLPDTNDRLERRLFNVVEEMALASGTSVPTVYIMDEEEAINAFVAGTQTSDTVLVATRGAIEQLTRQELQGVVAHEFSHIFNADMKMNVKLISILAGILLLGQAGYFIMRVFRYSSIKSNNKEGGAVVIAVFAIGISLYLIGSIGLFFGRLIKAAVSRQREYLADASAVQFARDNEGLAGAFIKIRQQSSLLNNSHAEETSHMCISEPVHLSLNGLRTHPPMESRLSAIMPRWEKFEIEQQKKAERKRNQQLQEDERAQKKAEAKDNNSRDDFGLGPLVDTIGKPSTLHMHAAGALLVAMPDIVKAAAHGHHSSAHAMHLVIALLLSDELLDNDNPMSSTAIELINSEYGEGSAKQVVNLGNAIKNGNRYLRLAVLDLTLPSLRRLSETEKARFFALLKQLIDLDDRISQFEYVLYALLQKNLNSMKTSGKRITSFSKVQTEIRVILSAMVHASGQDETQKQAAFKHLSLNFSTTPLEMMDFSTGSANHSPSSSSNNSAGNQHFDEDLFNNSLQTLNHLSPMLKKPFLSCLEEAIRDDGIVRAEEIELLRAIAECLDCPIPPMVESMQKQAASLSDDSSDSKEQT